MTAPKKTATKSELESLLNAGRVELASCTGVIAQLRTAFARRNALAGVMGLVFGGITPLACFVIAHFELDRSGSFAALFGQALTYAVVGCLVFSAKTVWVWTRQAFDCPWKATGFVVALEVIMTISHTMWLCVLILAVLIFVNAVATASTLAKQA